MGQCLSRGVSNPVGGLGLKVKSRGQASSGFRAQSRWESQPEMKAQCRAKVSGVR